MPHSNTPAFSCAPSRRGRRCRSREKTVAMPRPETPPTRTDMTRTSRRMRALVPLFALAVAAPAVAQTPPAGTPTTVVSAARPLTLAEAIALAEEQSEAIGIARAAVTRARGEVYRARSQYMPQLNGSARYSRTLSSEFENLGGSAPAPDPTAPPVPPGPCDAYILDPTSTPDERIAGL